MSDNVFLNANRSAVVDQFDPGKKWQVRRKEAVRLGLLPAGSEFVPQVRRVREDTSRPVAEPAPDTARTFSTGASPEVKARRKR